jgi:hypothetical protein
MLLLPFNIRKAGGAKKQLRRAKFLSHYSSLQAGMVTFRNSSKG